MARMPDFAAEAAEAVRNAVHTADDDVQRAFGRMVHHSQPAPVPTFTPAVQSEPSQPKEPAMSAAFDKIAHFLAVADEDAIDVINVILAHPEGLAALQAVAGVASIPFPAGTVTSALSTTKLILDLFAQRPSAAATAQQSGTQAAVPAVIQ